jgi:hypothetical protein
MAIECVCELSSFEALVLLRRPDLRGGDILDTVFRPSAGPISVDSALLLVRSWEMS